MDEEEKKGRIFGCSVTKKLVPLPFTSTHFQEESERKGILSQHDHPDQLILDGTKFQLQSCYKILQECYNLSIIYKTLHTTQATRFIN